MEKICWQITVAAFMQPLQYDLRSPAAKDNSITHAATAWSNLDAAIPMRSAGTELQNTIKLRATASENVAPKPDLDAKRKKDDFEALFKRIFRRKIISAKMEKKTHFVRDFLQNSIGNSSTSTTCNAIYIAGSILQLQITMEFHRQLIQQHHLQSHLHCGNDPAVANHNGILSTAHARKTVETPFTMRNRSEDDPTMIRPHTRPSRTRRTAEVDHRGSGTDFVWKNIGFRASAISQKRISCETSSKTPSATPPPAPLAMPCTLREASYSCKSQWNSIDNSSSSTTCNPIYIAGTILQLQITMEFCRPHMHEKQLKPHLQCGTDPRMIRPWSDHTRDRLAPVAPQR